MKLRITIAGNVYEADVEVVEEDDGEPGFAGYPAVAQYPVPGNAATLAAVQANGARNEFDKVCRSPVTGLVIQVNVEAGQAVEANELLMVLEAMKMETRITAPFAGTIKSVHVAPGNSVKTQQALLEFA
ncbi:MAG TPA: biotin/lipoyl-containing protein [Terracidiphilus sp.]|nr:biotin/lipoyl-containing protein [Terracidiphilus sp.]